jgi:hypothetical protein
MEQSHFWEANGHSASLEIPHYLWSHKVHYCVHKSWSLSWIRWIQSTTTIRSILILFSHLHRSLPSGLLPFSFSDKFLCISHLSHVFPMLHLSHPPWFDHPYNIWQSVQVMKLLIMQSSLASCHVIPHTSKYCPQ